MGLSCILNMTTDYLVFLAIDPGTNDCGISVYYCHPSDLSIIKIESSTIISDKVELEGDIDLLDSHTERYIKVKKVQKAFIRLLQHYQPHMVCCESPFYHKLHPGAYAPLVEIIFSLRDAVANFNKLIPMYLYEPLLIKKTLTGKAFADKNLMRASLSEVKEICETLTLEVSQLSEHAVDATAIGWLHLQSLRAKLSKES